jgi:mannose/fructose/N-acetylgalactosamine-specific phosphotransferase system component IIC
MHDYLLIAIIAGWLALDDRAGWQSLAGEPVFSALIVGLVFGGVGPALRCGVVLQLAWMSIGAARGSRRPNVVVGGVVGAGAACLSLSKSGDPREPLVIATAVLCGLIAGEAGQWVSMRAGIARERWLEKFQLPQDPMVASRNLTLRVVGSAAYVALVDAVFAFAAILLALPLTEMALDRAGAATTLATVWLAALPALAIATIVHAFATRALARLVAVGFLLAMVVAWLL